MRINADYNTKMLEVLSRAMFWFSKENWINEIVGNYADDTIWRLIKDVYKEHAAQKRYDQEWESI